MSKSDIYMEIARYCDANNVHPENIEPLTELFEELMAERQAITSEQLPAETAGSESNLTPSEFMAQAREAGHDALGLRFASVKEGGLVPECTCSVRWGHFSHCATVKK